ncbi:MAG: TIM barrel protein, partial [Chloroflexi bacterium]|nr:TIM barrel protein [Chloroflexota bacterium]
MPIQVGTAPDSWGVWFPDDPRQVPWQRFLDEVAESGYDSIELGPFGYLPTNPAQLDSELRQRSLRVAGGTLSGAFSEESGWSEMQQRTSELCQLLGYFDAHYVVLLDSASSPDAPDLNDQQWQCVRENLHRLADCTLSRSITPVFHPHADTTIQYEPQIEHLLELTDRALVNLCLDVGHHAYAGGEPVSFFRKHHARIPYLHLKDVDASVTAHVRGAGLPMSQAVADGAFVDLGQGCVDFPGLARVADEVGYDGWGIVEQDMYP